MLIWSRYFCFDLLSYTDAQTKLLRAQSFNYTPCSRALHSNNNYLWEKFQRKFNLIRLTYRLNQIVIKVYKVIMLLAEN